MYYAEEDLPTLSSGYQHVLFELPDHLGSASFVIDKATGELVEATRYQAYGSTESDYRPDRWNGYRTDHRFTGKEEDIEVGLVYFGARYYAPQLNRWISPDPLAIHEPAQADLNLYAYVHGRVLSAVDPFGLDDGIKATGWFQTIMSTLEIVGGVATMIGACSTGVGCGVGLYFGAATVLHGIDGLQAGIRQAATGEPARMGTEVALETGASAFTADKGTQHSVGIVGNILLGLGLSFGGSWANAGRSGSAVKDLGGAEKLTIPTRTIGGGAAKASAATQAAGKSPNAAQMIAERLADDAAQPPQVTWGAAGGSGSQPAMLYRAPQATPYTGPPNPTAARTPGEHLWGNEGGVDRLTGSPFESWTTDRQVAETFARSRGTTVQMLDPRTLQPGRVAADLTSPAGRAAAAARETNPWLKGADSSEPTRLRNHSLEVVRMSNDPHVALRDALTEVFRSFSDVVETEETGFDHGPRIRLTRLHGDGTARYFWVWHTVPDQPNPFDTYMVLYGIYGHGGHPKDWDARTWGDLPYVVEQAKTFMIDLKNTFPRFGSE